MLRGRAAPIKYIMGANTSTVGTGWANIRLVSHEAIVLGRSTKRPTFLTLMGEGSIWSARAEHNTI